MTVSSTNRKAGPYIGNDATVSFPFSFKVFSASDLYVVRADLTGTETVLALTANYTVALNSNQDTNPGGTVTLLSALASGYLLTITSKLDYLQPTDLTNQGGFYPKVITNGLDRLTIFVQQLAEQMSRALKYSITSPLGDSALPAPVANNVIGWNSTANGFQNYAPVDNSLLSASLAASDGAALVGFKQSGTGTATRTLQDKAREVCSLTDFVFADPTGETDSTIAIKCWLGQLALGKALEAPEGYFKFTEPLAIPAIDDIKIQGVGRQKTRFIYAGAATNIDLVTIGDGTTSFTGLNLKGFNIDSATTMTAGSGLRIRRCQNGGNAVKDVSFGKLNSSKNLWDGIWFDNVNVCSYDGFDINVQNEALIVNGKSSNDEGSDLSVDHGTITFPQVGIHCAGGFGGLYVGEVLVYGALTTGYKQSNDRVARGNREVVLSRECVLDGCNSYNVHVNDPLSNSAIIDLSAFITGAGWITPTVGDGIYIQSMPNGRVSIGSAQVKANVRHGINLGDTTTMVEVGTDTFISDNGGWGVYSSVATNNAHILGRFKYNTTGGVHQNVRSFVTESSTISASSGTITTKSGWIDWYRTGTVFHFALQVTITTNGTGAGSVIATLPFTARQSSVVTGRANGVSGKMLQGFIPANGSAVSIMNYDGSYPGANGEILLLSGSCEVY